VNRTSFSGVLETGDAQLVAGVLGAWAKAGALEAKVRLGGIEISHEDARLSLYCHDDSVPPGQPPAFLLEGSMAGPVEEAKASLIELREAFKARQVAASLEYVEVDEAGQTVGELAYLD
jgi:hypothetical protein